MILLKDVQRQVNRLDEPWRTVAGTFVALAGIPLTLFWFPVSLIYGRVKRKST